MSCPAPLNGDRRLFLALWPDAAIRRQLAALAESVAGRRRVRPENLHLTLVFLGATGPAQLAAYQAALATVAVPALELVLDCYGYWSRPRILWLGCRQPPVALLALVTDLQQRLRGCGFVPERRAFQAHITLARHFTGPVPAAPPPAPVRWPVRTIALVESLAGAGGMQHYQVRQRWPG